jgi:hypothetical protein
MQYLVAWPMKRVVGITTSVVGNDDSLTRNA